jgi:hypothetical protein
MRGGRWIKPTNDRKGCLYRIYYLASGTIFILVFPKKQTEILETGTMQDYI